MMSSGKTTLGRKLAQALNYDFVDLDKLIEQDQEKDIPAIFSESGEAYFRETESRVLKSLKLHKPFVLASGGGTPCFFDNMEFIKELGISIYLDVPAESLAKRIENHGKDDRPILSGTSSLVNTLTEKIEERTPYYSQAHFTLSGDLNVAHLLETLKPLL